MERVLFLGLQLLVTKDYEDSHGLNKSSRAQQTRLTLVTFENPVGQRVAAAATASQSEVKSLKC